jgi:hypothetical protein
MHNNLKTLLLLIFLLGCFFRQFSFAQVWGEPVTIYTGSYNANPDFTVDSDGVIHAVWSHRIEANFRKIFYSKSTDGGQSWSEAYDVAQNTALWLDNPHIVADSENNLYVTYDHNVGNTAAIQVYFQHFNGDSWSEPLLVSGGTGSARRNNLIMDYNNKLYCFWFSNSKIFYRTLHNGTWSEIVQPYSGNNDYYFLREVVVDINNNLYCAGTHRYEGQSSFSNRIIFFEYKNGIWSDIYRINEGRIMHNTDIDINQNFNPEVTWSEQTTYTPPIENGTFYSKRTDTDWLHPSLINNNNPSELAIAVDHNNTTHIINNEKIEGSYEQVHYRKISNTHWVANIIDNDKYGYYKHNLISYNQQLLKVFFKVDTIIGSSSFTSVVFNKYTIPEIIHISATSNPIEGGTITGYGNYYEGDTAELTAIPNHGYSFLSWTENDEIVSENTTLSFEVTQNRHLVANFRFINQVATFDAESNIVVYPNPAKQTVYIEIQGIHYDTENISLKLYDIFGRAMSIKPNYVNNRIISFDVSEYPAGIYFVQVFINKSTTKTTKLFIQK